MNPESHLNRLREDLLPEQGQKDRVRAMMMNRIKVSPMLEQAKKESSPAPDQQSFVWSRVLQQIDAPVASGVLGRLKSFFEPSSEQHLLLRSRLLSQLSPVEVRTSYRWTKWTAAFALVLVALRVSPALFLAPHTIAESAVMLVPTRGAVELALHGLWQPVTDEITLNQAVQLKTSNGEATVLLHDDGTIRLGENTTITLHDLSDRPEPALDGPTLTVTSGRVWLQGLLPMHLRGITVATPYGDVIVHGGSVSITVEDAVIVRTFDRHAVLTHAGKSVTLVAGDRARFGEGDDVSINHIADDEYTDPWVAQNLQRDAVHQREIAQMQQERRAAQAGILPSSPLYSVKRVAERVDVLFTLDPEAKVQKQLDQASTRLNEAAAMISAGDNNASVPLQEYKNSLIAIANGTGGNTITQFLVRQEIAENTADLSAALPDDQSYLLKKTVLESSAELPGEVVDASDVQGMILMDTVDSLHTAIEEGNTEKAQETYDAIAPYLSALKEGTMFKPDVKKEVLSLLTEAAEKLQDNSGSGVLTDALANELKPYLPADETVLPVTVPLTDEQIVALVAEMKVRIFRYTQPRSRWNQLQYEIAQLKGHTDEGRILRRMYLDLPEEGLGRYVRTAIQQLRDEQAQ